MEKILESRYASAPAVLWGRERFEVTMSHDCRLRRED